MLSAASRIGTLNELTDLYRQTQELLLLNPDEKETATLRPGRNIALPEAVNDIFDIRLLQQMESYEDVLKELAFSFAKMELKGYHMKQRQQLCELAWKLLFENGRVPETTLAAWADALCAAWKLSCPEGRSREILLAVYENLSNSEFGLQHIARERLFISEDHLRRIFSQLTGKRFLVYLEQCRIEQARRLIEYKPDIKISRLAEMVGYPTDGQYFSKVFRKINGVSPSEYKIRC